MPKNPHNEIKDAYNKKVLFTSHALSQMNLTERMIMREEVMGSRSQMPEEIK